MKWLRKLFILPVRIYQYTISPLLGSTCRHQPTCSQYTIEAIEEWGVVKGMWLGAKRISKCHPWGTHGYDPIPKQSENESGKQNEKQNEKQSENESGKQNEKQSENEVVESNNNSVE